MKLAVLGGSFNPVHFGHLALARAVAAELDYDLVLLIPAAISPLKGEADGASAADRLDLVQAAVASQRRLAVDDCEIRRSGVSYTIDTLDDLENRYRPDGKIGFVIGDDLLADFPRWRQAETVARRADILVARRLNAVVPSITAPSISTPSAIAPGAITPSVAFPCRFLNNPIRSLSSSDVRRRIAADDRWRHLVPLGTRRLIIERRLYGYTARPAGIAR